MPQAKLEVKTVLDDGLTAGFKRAENAAKGFATRLKKPFGELGAAIFSIRGAAATFASVIGARFAGRLVLSVAETTDAIGKLSERIGFSTEQLSTLRFAAEQTGSNFETITTAIRTATQRLGEFASTGKGQAAQALKDLGIAEAVSNGEQLEELLPRIADALQGIESQAERVNLSSKLFGETGGPAFLNLLQTGSKGLRDFRTEAERLGLVIGEDQAKNAADFNDEMNRLKKTFEGFARDAIAPLLPELREFLELLRTTLEAMRRAREERSKFLLDQARAQGAGGKGIPRSLAPGDFAPPPGASPSPGDFSFVGPVQPPATEELTASVQKAATATRQLKQESFDAAAGVQDLRNQFQALSSARAVVFDLGSALADNLTTGLTDFVQGTKSAKEAFSDMAKSILADIQRIVIRALVARALGALLGPGGGAVGGAVASFQHGGFVPAGTTQRAVLHGPELVVPLSRRFQPQIAGGGGASTTIINISAIDVEDFDRKMAGSMRRQDTTVAGIVANATRNTQQLRGAFAR